MVNLTLSIIQLIKERPNCHKFTSYLLGQLQNLENRFELVFVTYKIVMTSLQPLVSLHSLPPPHCHGFSCIPCCCPLWMESSNL